MHNTGCASYTIDWKWRSWVPALPSVRVSGCRRRDSLRDRTSIALEGGGASPAAVGEMSLLRRSQRGGGQGQGESEASTIARSPDWTYPLALPNSSSVAVCALPLWTYIARADVPLAVPPADVQLRVAVFLIVQLQSRTAWSVQLSVVSRSLPRLFIIQVSHLNFLWVASSGCI